jgi:thiamine biosynthesis lipoprotein
MEPIETILEHQPVLVWYWQQHNFKAMNTQVSTRLYSQTNAPVLADVGRLFKSFEKRLSRFDPTSELSRLNAAETEFFQASPTLLDALEVALLAAEATEGLYDPTVLDVLEKAGYDRSFEKLSQPAPLTITSALHPSPSPLPRFSAPSPSRFTFRSVTLNRPRRQVYKPVGLRLDFGWDGQRLDG